MSAFSDYAENAIVEHMLRGSAMPVPSTIYIALFTADPTDAGTGPEVTTAAWPAYARQDAAQGGLISTGWTPAANGVTSNAKVVTFPANNGASPVTVTHVGIYSALTGGNLLFKNALTQSKTLQPGDVLSFAIGALQITVA